MKEILKIIKRHFILLLGTGLFTYGLFSFDFGIADGLKSCWKGMLPNLFNLPTCPATYPVATYYYYNNTSLILLTIGVIFIVIGLLKMKKEKEANLEK